MAWFIDQLFEIGSLTNVFTTIDVLIVLVISTFLSLIAAKTYQRTHDGVSYSHIFVHTTVMFSVVVSMIMLIIGSNIARAFTLVGALSIVRFRNAIKETRDVGFIFFMMAIGMAVGTRFYMLAFIMTFYVCLLILLLHAINFGSRKINDEIMKIVTPIDLDYERHIEPILQKELNFFQLLNIEATSSKKLQELVYLVRFKKNRRKRNLFNKIKKVNENNPVYVFGTDHLIY